MVRHAWGSSNFSRPGFQSSSGFQSCADGLLSTKGGDDGEEGGLEMHLDVIFSEKSVLIARNVFNWVGMKVCRYNSRE